MTERNLSDREIQRINGKDHDVGRRNGKDRRKAFFSYVPDERRSGKDRRRKDCQNNIVEI